MILATLGDQAKTYPDRNTMKNMIYGDGQLTLVAKRKESLLGLINGTLLGFPRIMFLAVADEQSAREGLGVLLIDQFVKEIKKSLPQAKSILHNEFADNYSAIGLYSAKGFKVTGFIEDPITNRNVVFMEKTV
jgi:ribosomal protein S18 acetylase RimI-like enzyme